MQKNKIIKKTIPLVVMLSFATTGFVFAETAKNNTDQNNTSPSQNLTTAAISYNGRTATFDSLNGKPLIKTPIQSDLTITRPADPTFEGNKFLGWGLIKTSNTPYDFTNNKIASDVTFYAIWEPIKKTHSTITFDTNGGSSVESIKVENDKVFSEPNTKPTKNGYVFTGWYSDKEAKTKWDFKTRKVLYDKTLYAGWQNEFNGRTATFNSNGGGAADIITKIAGDNTITPPATPTRDGYKFLGWGSNKTTKQPYDFTKKNIVSDATFYAIWENIAETTYDVHYDSLGGNLNKIISVKGNTLLTKPTDPINNHSYLGLHFKGWYRDKSYVTPWNFEKDKVTSNMTLYACWSTVVPENSTISFNSNGGSTVSAITVKSGTLISEPATPTKTKYIFNGWYTDANLKTKWDFASNKTAGNTTLYAGWTQVTNGRTATFDGNGNGMTAIKIPIGVDNRITTPTINPTRDGYKFLGWGSNKTTKQPYDFTKKNIVSDATFYAIWEKVAETTYDIHYDSLGGNINKITSAKGNTLLIKPADPVRNGFQFKGWYLDKSYVTPWNFATDKVSGAMTLYACWSTMTTENSTISFNSNGGSAVSAITAKNGTLISEPTPPTKTKAIFDGWYKDQRCRTKWDFAKDKATTNTTLFAKWTGVCTISFDTNGGSVVPAQQIKALGKITTPINPTRENYKFTGWFLDSACLQKVNMNGSVLSDRTLYAGWENNAAATYTVKFNSNRGSSVATITTTGNKTTNQPKNPTKSKAYFTGWFKDRNLITKWNFATDKVTENTTLYAGWTAQEPGTYSVGFNSNGGSRISAISAKQGTTITEPKAPTKRNYTFAGWYKDIACTTKWNFASDTSTTNTTLFAKWDPKIITYTISFNSNGGTAVERQVVIKNNKLKEPKAPTKIGYDFDGWYTSRAGKTKWDFDNNTAYRTTTLYAHWTPAAQTN